jgi:ribosomal peptide maturation radical SAM protein 1
VRFPGDDEQRAETPDPRVVGLVSMPWMSPHLPSIQLATIAGALARDGIASEVHELYLDYAAWISVDLYDVVSNGSGAVEEWLFARQYFGPETGDWLESFHEVRPPIGLRNAAAEDEVVGALARTTGAFLDAMVARYDWSRYDVIGFSLTISQIGPSMAMARHIKRAYPDVRVVFGGTACAGPAGAALMRICPYVDAVVTTEGEAVIGPLVRCLRAGVPPAGTSGVVWRDADGVVHANGKGDLLSLDTTRPPLDHDAYFERVARLDLGDRVTPWIPFESSRGCWWGERKQCTFCGLHEIMQFRQRPWDATLAELEHHERRYGVTRFFAVDLIMPRDYPDTLLKEIERRGHEWSLFYEIKASVSREFVEQLARAGVTWVQPGIESLDTEVLKLMRKGTHPLHNVALLKWCRELGIRVTWNVILGSPGEDPAAYPLMADRMRSLFHLEPPNGRNEFALHRFSPYFDDPAAFGLTNRGPRDEARRIFPVADADLADLAYEFEYDVEGRAEAPGAYGQVLQEAVAEWKAASARGAALVERSLPDGSLDVVNTRYGDAVTYRLAPHEARLFGLLDARTPLRSLERTFEGAFPDDAATVAAEGGVAALVEAWEARRLVLRVDEQVVSLPVREGTAVARPRAEHAPVSYLVST